MNALKRVLEYRRSLPVLYFLSGAAALVYEIAWMRKLSLILGGTVFAVSLITASFMLGLALGSRFIGKKADRAKRPVVMFAQLAAGIGVFGLFSPIAFSLLSSFSAFLFSHAGLTGFSRSALQFSLAGCALIVPTVLMGATFPVMAKAYAVNERRRQRDIGWLCFVNTLGGALGCFLAGFFLVRLLGVNTTIFCAAGTDLLIAAAAALIGRTAVTKPVPGNREVPEDVGGIFPDAIIMVALVTLGVSGFCSLAYQVLWTKLLTFFFLDSVYDFAIVLTAFLAGLALGSAVFGALAGNPRRSLLLFGLAELGAGIAAIAFLYLIQRLPYLAADLYSMPRLRQVFGEHFFLPVMTIKFGYAFLIMLVPTFLLGGALPLVTGICAGRPHRFAADIGRMYMMNTLGAVAGSLTVCFALLSLFGSRLSILALALLNSAAGLVILLLRYRGAAARVALSIGSAALVSLLILALPPWDKIRMSASFFDPGADVENTIDLLFYKEDAYGVTSVMRSRPLAQKFLVTNRNYVQNASILGGSEDHRRLGHIPLFLHPDPSRVAVIGLATGITLSGAARHDLERLDCAEISGAVLSAAELFSQENGDILNHPKITFTVNDGRNFLAETRARYDVIIGDILFPMGAGAAYLFTTDYFSLMRKRLRPGGLACVWLPLNQFSRNDLRTVVASFYSVFPHTALWLGLVGESVPVLGCVGTGTPLRIDFASLHKRLSDRLLHDDLTQIGLDNPVGFTAGFIMADEEVRTFSEGMPLNTDDRPIIEFSSPLQGREHRPQGAINLVDLINHGGSILPRLELATLPDSTVTRLKQEIPRNTRVHRLMVAGLAAAMNDRTRDALGRYREALALLPGHAETREHLSRTVLRYQMHCLSKGHSSYDPLEALGLYRDIIDTDPSTEIARIAFEKVGKILMLANRPNEALRMLDKGLGHFKSDTVLIGLRKRVDTTPGIDK
ncbi:MAG: fused MFS/spermidine synthase [Chitinispirillaceae bacterium]|nr:fused MFS/spermidine synthase [Chitinispirillaceae bacterium]